MMQRDKGQHTLWKHVEQEAVCPRQMYAGQSDKRVVFWLSTCGTEQEDKHELQPVKMGDQCLPSK